MSAMRLEDLNPALRARVRAAMGLGGVRGRVKPSCKPTVKLGGKTRPSKAKTADPNATEAEYNRRFLAGAGIYEGVTLRLPGGSRYTPDWLSVCTLGFVHLHEVKGAHRFPSEGRALTAWREAKAAFPMFRFHWAAESADGWEFRHGTPNPAVLRGANS